MLVKITVPFLRLSDEKSSVEFIPLLPSAPFSTTGWSDFSIGSWIFSPEGESVLSFKGSGTGDFGFSRFWLSFYGFLK